ncbi:MAG: nucleotidyltransferase family protein [Clostridium sp.]|jgi:hypothetical protein|nr:nucleotidyltransferase family protein [Clostridium sp.]
MNIFEAIVALSKNSLNDQECNEIENYLIRGADWDLLIGQLFFHKIVCRAYKHFAVQEWLDFIPPAIRWSWQRQFDLNEYKNNLRKNDFTNLLNTFNKENIRYCIIKGFPIEKDLFINSVREFNDTDLMVHFRDFESVNKTLTNLGYSRGIYNSSQHKIEIDRHTDIFHIVNTHQTVPYRKLSDDPLFRFDTIDLQFELTLQKKYNFDIDVDLLLNDRVSIDVFDKSCFTLNPFDNFIMLCTHLYGEAILIQEIKKYKDLQLMKFADIYEWIEKYYNLYNWEEKIEYITSHGLLKPVLYCLHILSNLYASIGSKNICLYMGEQDLSFLDEYRDEYFNVKKWNVPVMDRIFRVDKFKML